MKKLLTVGALALGLGACAQAQNAVDWLNKPDTQKAIETLKVGTTAIVCRAAVGINFADTIEHALQTGGVQIGQVALTNTDTAVVVSAAVCEVLSGTVTGTTVVTPKMGSHVVGAARFVQYK